MSEPCTTASTEMLQVFEENAATYDRVNTVISLGLDAWWRNWVAHRALSRPGARVLDAFAGTGLVGLRSARLGAQVTLADASCAMLEQAERRARRRGLHVSSVRADLAAAPLPAFPDAPFDAITMVFGVRYLDRPSEVIRRLSALLAPTGRFVVLEFAEPSGGLISRLAAFYFFRVLPKIASALSGHPELYRLLGSTTHRIHGSRALERIVEESGLRVSETRIMGFGLVVGIVAELPNAERAA